MLEISLPGGFHVGIDKEHGKRGVGVVYTLWTKAR